ncbi:MFS transporter [Rhodococcus sp. SC4]|nr:MFS transporter [Rhodococcus sp. SC4]
MSTGSKNKGQAVASARTVALASGIGTTIEWYDFFLYGTASALVFGHAFFPAFSPLAGTLAAFATFAVGFVARPIGGALMGHFGDRIGRKRLLVWSLTTMGAATMAVGLLPTYAQIGVWAPILLVALRFIQGFALGGEWGGAALMSVEHAPRDKRGWYGSFVALGLPLGVTLSNLVFLLVVSLTSPEQLLSWGWRIPFLASFVMVVIGLFVRVRVSESPVFLESQSAKAPAQVPIITLAKHHWREVLLAAGTYLGVTGTGYVVVVYFVSYATQVLHLSRAAALLYVCAAAIGMAVAVATCARWSDTFGRRRVGLWGCGLMLVWSFVFFPLVDSRSPLLILVSVVVMGILIGSYLGPQPAVFAELFPTEVRYSGASVSNQLGTILGGALVPFVATGLYAASGSSVPLTLYTAALAGIALASVWGLKETYRRDLTATAPHAASSDIPTSPSAVPR